MKLVSREQGVLIGFFLFWLLFFWRGWYVLSYTKIWELSQMLGQSREQQLMVLHPAGEMRELLRLKALLKSEYHDRSVVIEAPYRDQRLPQAHDASILRSVFYPIPVKTQPENISNYDLIVRIVATSSGKIDKALPEYCPLNHENCTCAGSEKLDKDVLCWIMP